MNVLIAYKVPQAEIPGALHSGLGVTAGNTADMLVEHGIPSIASGVADGYYLRDQLRAGLWPGVSHVVLCAPFFDTPFLKALCGEFPALVFAVVFHSNVGFLGVDNWSTQVLGEQISLQSEILNFHVAGNSAKFCAAVAQAFEAPCALLPNLYFLSGHAERLRAPWNAADGPLRIGAFGATRVLKNLPTAAWAARILSNQLATPIEFWVSSGREEGTGADRVTGNVRKLFAGSPKLALCEAVWAPWLEFRRSSIRHMHLLLQPSFTESFNGVTADGICEGVPSVVGPAIDWVPLSWQANPDDAVAVAHTAAVLLRDRNAPGDGFRALMRHNADAIGSWREFLRPAK